MGRRSKSSQKLASLIDEFSGVDLGDARRDRRLLRFVDAFGRSPDKSLPRMARDEAELEAMYRFCENEGFDAQDVLLPHREATALRASEAGTVLVVHDASKFSFTLVESVRRGCDAFGKTQGFWGAFSLAISADSLSPLGTLGFTTWTRSELPPRRNPNQRRDKERVREGYDCGRIEAERWLEFIRRSEECVQDPSKLVHVIDCEADSFVLFLELLKERKRFAVRMSSVRKVGVDDASEFLAGSDAAKRATTVLEIEVPVSKRTAVNAKRSRHPARAARVARLSFSAMPISIRGGRGAEGDPTTLTLNLVCVIETAPPEGEEPIEWFILTSEPIDSARAIAKVVRYYKARWTIEEFFRVVKSGCAFEERQLETRDALLKVLAISLVHSWRVLLLRSVARLQPDSPATTVLSPLQISILKATGRVQLSGNPTAADALCAVAALGGHIKNNGQPGVRTLSRGMERLTERVVGYALLLRELEAAKM